MKLITNLICVSIIWVTTACNSTQKGSKSIAGNEYSEDLSAYLPKELVKPSTTFPIENSHRLFDSTFIITARLDSALLLVNNYNRQQTGYIEGLTIQLYSGTDRSEAKEVQMRAFRHFPDSKPKVIFDQPNYKVRVEEFYSPLEAYPVFKSVQSKFSKAILVPTRIKISQK